MISGKSGISGLQIEEQQIQQFQFAAATDTVVCSFVHVSCSPTFVILFMAITLLGHTFSERKFRAPQALVWGGVQFGRTQKARGNPMNHLTCQGENKECCGAIPPIFFTTLLVNA